MSILDLINFEFPPRLRKVIILAWLILTFLYLYDDYTVRFEVQTIQELIVNSGIIFGFYFFLDVSIHFIFGLFYWSLSYSIFIYPYIHKAPIPGNFDEPTESFLIKTLKGVNELLIVRDTRKINNSLLFKVYTILSRFLDVIVIFLSFVLYSNHMAPIFSIIGISIAIILYIFGIFLAKEG